MSKAHKQPPPCKFCGKVVDIHEGSDLVKHGDGVFLRFFYTRDDGRWVLHHAQCAIDAGDVSRLVSIPEELRPAAKQQELNEQPS